MVFTQKHIDDMIVNWEEIMRPQSFGHYSSLGPESLVALQLSVSDANKPLLLANPGFIPHCIDSLLVDPEHPRVGAAEDKKIFVQEMYAECLAQLALWPDGREALLRDGSVVDALQAVRDQGLSDQSKEIVANALLSLSDEPPPVPAAEEGEHIMMSYQWDVQPAIKRLVANLQLRGYSVWFDIEQVRMLLKFEANLINVPA